MALNKAQLTADILKAFEDAKKIEKEPPEAAPLIAAALADAIDAYVRGAAVRGVKCEVPLDVDTTNVSGHVHKVSGTIEATQSEDGTLE
jgi:hypothetical protein